MAPGTRRPHHDSELISCCHDAFRTWGHYHNNIGLFYHDSPITRSHFMDPTNRAIKGFYCTSCRVMCAIMQEYIPWSKGLVQIQWNYFGIQGMQVLLCETDIIWSALSHLLYFSMVIRLGRLVNVTVVPLATLIERKGKQGEGYQWTCCNLPMDLC